MLPLQEFFQIVSHRTHDDTFIRLLDSPCVHAPHRQKVHQRTQHRLYRAASYFPDVFPVHFLQAPMHSIIKWFVNAIINFFKVTFANTHTAQRTGAALFGAAAIDFHLISKRSGDNFFKWQMNTTAAGVPIIFFIIDKAFPRWFVLTKVGNVTSDIIFFQCL